MQTSRLLSRFLFACLLGLTLVFARAEQSAAAPKSDTTTPRPDEAPLVIANGKLVRDGRETPATLKNVIEIVQQRYPEANITIIGVENVVIGPLTLNWARRDHLRDDDTHIRINPPLDGVLAAVATASGEKFFVQRFSDSDFMLRPPDRGQYDRSRTLRVFNLAKLVGPSAQIRDLEGAALMLEAQRAVLSDRLAPNHPDIADINNRIKETRLGIESLTKSSLDPSKLLNQIHELLEQTLAEIAPGEKSPEFKYHAGTHLLVVIGTERAVDTTRMIVEALERNP